jgi:hypothetical protein
MKTIDRLREIKDNINRKRFCRSIGCPDVVSLTQRALELAEKLPKRTDPEEAHDVLYWIGSRLLRRSAREIHYGDGEKAQKSFDKVFFQLCAIKNRYWSKILEGKCTVTSN